MKHLVCGGMDAQEGTSMSLRIGKMMELFAKMEARLETMQKENQRLSERVNNVEA